MGPHPAARAAGRSGCANLITKVLEHPVRLFADKLAAAGVKDPREIKGVDDLCGSPSP